MNAKRLPLSLFTLFLLVLLLTACGGGLDAEPQVPDGPIGIRAEDSADQAVEVTRVVTEWQAGSEATPLPMPTPTAAPTAAAAPTRAAPTPAAAPTTIAPGNMRFAEYELNPFINTSDDHLSTFALDVDTGSYTLMRRYVQNGQLPPAASVRVEEYLNYFDQGYPAAASTFALHADGAPSPFHDDGSVTLRFGVQGYTVPAAERLPVALTFVVDTSGSMGQSNRLGLVKQSLNLLVEQLDAGDTVALVAYGSRAEILLQPTDAGQKETIRAAVDGLRAGGSTNAEAGLLLGYRLANQSFRSDGVNRVILASDGVANVGATDAQTILERIATEAEGGITLTSVGVGMGNYSDAFMEQMADRGDGQYAYVDTAAEARRVFVDDMTGTLQAIALDAKAQVDFNPEVVAEYRLVGFENRAVADQDFRNDSVDAGEIGAGHAATALYAVKLHPDANGRIATFQIRWQDPDTYLVHEMNHNLNTWDLAAHFETAVPHYRLAATAAQYAEVLRQSPWAADTTLADLYGPATQLVAELPQETAVAEFANLLVQASPLLDNSITNGKLFPVNVSNEVEEYSGVNRNLLVHETPLAQETTGQGVANPHTVDWGTLLLLLAAGGGGIIWWYRGRQQSLPVAQPSPVVQAARAKVQRARQYRRQVQALLARRRHQALYAPFLSIVESFDHWEARMEQLVERLVAYEANQLLHEDAADLSTRIKGIKMRLAAEPDPALRQQLAATLAQYEEHQQQLAALSRLMERTQLQLDGTVTAMGTIYSQLEMLQAMDVASGRVQEITADIEDEVQRLHDLLAAVDEVRAAPDPWPGADAGWPEAPQRLAQQAAQSRFDGTAVSR